jgi:hypothetical protein
VTITQAQAGRRGVLVEPMVHPSPTISLPIATPAQAEHQYPLPLHVTKGPEHLMIRGLLFPRQTMRTDTSTRTSYITTYITRTSWYTSTDYYTETSTSWTTTVSTRTSALDAQTTVHSTQTLTLRAGETIPIQPQETEPGNPQVSGRHKAGLSTGAKAGIGIGAALGAALIAVLIGFIIKRKKRDSPSPTVAVMASGPQAHDNKQPVLGVVAMSPTSPPPPNPSNQTTMHQMSPPLYQTPSPQPGQHNTMYGYPQSPQGPQTMSMYGVPTTMGMQQPQQQYQYPKPPEPSHSPAIGHQIRGGNGPVTNHGQGQWAHEMPSVYSPQPHRSA